MALHNLPFLSLLYNTSMRTLIFPISAYKNSVRQHGRSLLFSSNLCNASSIEDLQNPTQVQLLCLELWESSSHLFCAKKHVIVESILTASSYIKQVQAIPGCSCCNQNMRWLQLILVICSSRVLNNIYAHNLSFDIFPDNFGSKCIDYSLWTSNFFNCCISIQICEV